MQKFLYEIKKFSKNNWWIYLIFLACLFVIYKTNSWNLLEVVLVFFFHFLWDIFIMMMWDYLVVKEEKKALYSQTVSFIIFSLIGIYAWITKNNWNYLIPQSLFIWPLIKWFCRKIKFANYKFLIFIWVIVFSFYYYFWLIQNIWTIIQILGFIIFPIALVLDNEKLKYFFSLIWIFFIFLGSAYFLYLWFINKNIVWTDLSYTLLPLTVLVVYLKNFRNYL